MCTAGTDDSDYPDVKQRKDIKPPEFYELHAQDRKYFYYVNDLGRLYLEDMWPKSIATSLKSAKFLAFFFSRVRRNDPELGLGFPEYPFVSPCGKEMNYIKAADTPIVFEQLVEDEEEPGKFWLLYGGESLRYPFDPTALRMADGRLYHTFSSKHLPDTHALMKSHLTLSIQDDITIADEGADYAGTFTWKGEQYPIVGSFWYTQSAP